MNNSTKSTATSRSTTTPKSTAIYVSPGMPPLDTSGNALSFFEFWPTWLMYLPVAIQWLALSVRYRSLTLPLLANPALPLSGMMGVPKSQLMGQATGECKQTILPWFNYLITEDDSTSQALGLIQRAEDQGISLPFVCKPDIGCRGSGVKLIADAQQLSTYLGHYPIGTSVIVQQLSTWEPEAGIFFVKQPGQDTGGIISLALKYSPYVLGDGKHTVAQLIEQDTRASQLSHLYKERHGEKLQQVLPQGEPFKLVFSASHCRGAIFRDARHLITEALTHRINKIMAGLPEFYYGRLDVKFADISALIQGRDLEIVEINTASSESLHIWDRKTTLRDAIGSLLLQYQLLFKLGHQNRRRGFSTPSLPKLLRGWKEERKLQRCHPVTD